MSEVSNFTLTCLVVGLLLLVMSISHSFIARLPLSAAMLYLAVGAGMGPDGFGLLKLDPLRDAVLLERLTEIAVLISLFVAGMKLDMPLQDRRWRTPFRLASVSMVITVACITAIGYGLMGLSLGAAVLLGGVLAPTDPVLASDVQLSDERDRDRLRLGLTGEGGLNDGTAFPFVMLGLGLLGLHDLGAWGWRWWLVDVLWATAAGLGIGYLLGGLVGQVVLYLRVRHREALGSDEFIALGLIALTYGVAVLCHTYGFLAVFAAGYALRQRKSALSPAPALAASAHSGPASAGTASCDPPDRTLEPATEPANLMQAVVRLNAQLERFAEVVVVLAVGALLAVVAFRVEVLWFVPVLFGLVRPLAVLTGLLGNTVLPQQKRLMAWFGIRGIGSVYYLMYAISHGLDDATAAHLTSITLSVVVASVVAHGTSVTPLMRRYEQRQRRQRRRRQARARLGKRRGGDS